MKCFSVFSAGLLAFGLSSSLTAGMHPDVPLLDNEGESVLTSGKPLSTMVTCGGACHDTAYIMAHSDHADAGASQLDSGSRAHGWQAGPGYFGGWNPLAYDLTGLDEGAIDVAAWLQGQGARHVGGGPAAGLVEMNCLLCHAPVMDLAARSRALAVGDFAWANSVGLAGRDILLRGDEGWTWNAEKFQDSGALREGLLPIGNPRDGNCGQCHGIVDNDLHTPLTIAADPGSRPASERTGQLISPQKLSDSGLNLSGKDELTHPFDVHADRVVGCVNCHYSLNNPVYFRQRAESRPDHLVFDPRRLSLAEYLQKPLHQFAKGRATLGLAAETKDSLRRCASCHEADTAHDWLPYKARHFTALACESCHIPALYGPALQSIDWTVLDRSGKPVRTYRNSTANPASPDSLIEGFSPALLPRKSPENGTRLAPWNLVTAWYWTGGEPQRPLDVVTIRQALLQDGAYHPEVVAALDTDGNGDLAEAELRLDDETRIAAIRGRLQAAGVVNPSIHGEVLPFPVSHNVVNGQWATRECRTCHGADSALGAPFVLAGHRPPGATLALPEQAGLDAFGVPVDLPESGLAYAPDVSRAGFYVLGLHSFPWVDRLGILMFLGISLGVAGHALGRWIAGRRRPRNHAPTEKVYMYDAYERLWHWLQAIAILMLLFTGMIIHKPQTFGMFSFAYVVQVHNVLGFILLINAALALFYNLASGEIRQYLPQPHGFVGRSIAQALYYSRGIFAGQPHPIEKTRQQKLNPLQQITYLGILNVLLPAQVISGVLIWGLQRWPEIAAALGGFQALALVHTLVAWTFAAFIVMHVYLTTAAGHTPAAGIKAMIEGWDAVGQNGSAASKGAKS